MIPRVLHQIWVGGPIPARLQMLIDTWRPLHPDWEYRLWTEDDLAGWLTNRDLFDNAARYTASTGQFRADVARYEILHAHGGVYVDVDFEARRPLDPLCTVPAWAAWEVDGRWVNNAILGAVPGHPFFADLIDGLPHSVARNPGRRPNVMTGPQYVTPFARRWQQRGSLVIHPARMFYPYLHDELERAGDDFPDAWAVHHWDNARRRAGVVDA